MRVGVVQAKRHAADVAAGTLQVPIFEVSAAVPKGPDHGVALACVPVVIVAQPLAQELVVGPPRPEEEIEVPVPVAGCHGRRGRGGRRPRAEPPQPEGGTGQNHGCSLLHPSLPAENSSMFFKKKPVIPVCKCGHRLSVHGTGSYSNCIHPGCPCASFEATAPQEQELSQPPE